MSGCGGNCSCGSNCICGDSCKCGKRRGNMYHDIENTTTSTLIAGVAPPAKMYSEGTENSFGVEGGNACSCGASCKCNPCKC